MNENQKFTHEEVGYENHSTHVGQQCVGCKHFIPARGGQPTGCEGVQRPIQISAWCHRFELASKAVTEKNMAEEKKKKHHEFKHTMIVHHDDGSHTTTHHHESGDSKKNKEYASSDHDSMMDGMMDNTSAPNPGEAQADAGDHGVPEEQAAPAGLPGAPPQAA